MSHFPMLPMATPPKAPARDRQVLRADRHSVDSTTSYATTDIQTPDRAHFPRFTGIASPAAAVQAGSSCAGVTGEARVEGGDVMETVWEDMDAGGLLEVKIGNLLNLTPRLSACYLRPISPSSDLAFEQDYDVQPDDSPLLPPTYVSPSHACSFSGLKLPEAVAASGSTAHVGPTKVRPQIRPSTADDAPASFGSSRLQKIRPRTSTEGSAPPSAGMSRSTSDKAHLRAKPSSSKVGAGHSLGLGIDLGARKGSVAWSSGSGEASGAGGAATCGVGYLGRLSFGDDPFELPGPITSSSSPSPLPIASSSSSYPTPHLFRLEAKEKGKGRAMESEEPNEQEDQEQVPGASSHLSPSTFTHPRPPTPSSSRRRSGRQQHHHHTPGSPGSCVSSIYSARTAASSSSSKASLSSSKASISSVRSGPPRSIPSRTSSKYTVARPPPACAFSPPPRSSSLATPIQARGAGAVGPPNFSGASRRGKGGNRTSVFSVFSISSVLSDNSDIAPSPLRTGTSVLPAIPTFPATPPTAKRADFTHTARSRSFSTNRNKRQAVYFPESVLQPYPTPLLLGSSLSTYAEELDSANTPIASSSRTVPLFSSRLHLRRTRSAPSLKTTSDSTFSTEMSKLRGLRERQSFFSPKRDRSEVSSGGNGTPSGGSAGRGRRTSILMRSSPSHGSNGRSPSPGSPFRSRSSRLGLSGLAVWGGKLHPQGIMHIAEPKDASSGIYRNENASTAAVHGYAPSLDPDLDLGTDIDLDDLESLHGNVPTSAAAAQSYRLGMVAARKIRLLASASADILAEVEAQDEEQVLYLAEKREDMSAWEEAQGWNWPMPPYRPSFPPTLEPTGAGVQRTSGLGLDVGVGMTVREPKFLKPKSKPASSSDSRAEAPRRGSAPPEDKRDSVQSSVSNTSLKSALTSSSIASAALLTPDSVHSPSTTSYLDISVTAPTSSVTVVRQNRPSARYMRSEEPDRTEKDLPKLPTAVAGISVTSLHPPSPSATYADCPTTPTAPCLPLGSALTADGEIDMDVTPKAPSRSESLQAISDAQYTGKSRNTLAPAAPIPAAADVKPMSAPLSATEAIFSLFDQRSSGPRKYGSTPSLPLLAASASEPASNGGVPFPVLSTECADSPHNPDAPILVAEQESAEARERSDSAFKAWSKKRKAIGRAMLEAHRQRVEAHAKARALMPATSDASLRSTATAQSASGGSGRGDAMNEMRVKAAEEASAPKVRKSGSSNRASGLKLWGAMSYEAAALATIGAQPSHGSTGPLRAGAEGSDGSVGRGEGKVVKLRMGGGRG